MRFKVETNGASILADDQSVIEGIIDANRVKTVLEFGPGASTAVFLNKGLLVHSCENDERWLAAANSKFGSAATFFHYENVDKIKIDGLLDQYNLCFVDGPKGKPSWSRLNSLLFCAAKSRLILLHDSSRGGEKQSVEVMKNIGFEAEFFDTRKGLVLLVKN